MKRCLPPVSTNPLEFLSGLKVSKLLMPVVVLTFKKRTFYEGVSKSLWAQS
jgi:hypothetical protein